MVKLGDVSDVLYCRDVSRTQQNAKDECDINIIVNAAKRGADIGGSLNSSVPQYGDFTGLPSYKDALNVVVKANEMFMSLDAFVRERFGNDPHRLLTFLDDPANLDEAVKLGLVERPPVAVPPPVVDPLDAVAPVSVKSRSKPKADEE